MLTPDNLLSQIRERVTHPATARELAQLLKIPREERKALTRALKALVTSGALLQIRGGRFGLADKMDLVVGRLTANPGGFGFVVPEDASPGDRRDVYIADDFIIVEELSGDDPIRIGDRVSIAPRVTLVTSSHPNNSRIREFAPLGRGPVTIEADAWIGSGSIVLPGGTIGRGAVVGAQSVVAADVAPLHVVAGQPARTIRVLTPPATWS